MNYYYLIWLLVVLSISSLVVGYPIHKNLKYVDQIYSKSNIISNEYNNKLTTSLQILSDYDEEYRNRLLEERKFGLNPKLMDFRRAQTLQSKKLIDERISIHESSQEITKSSSYIVLGIMCTSGFLGIQYLRSWVDGLSLKRGYLRAVDDLNNEIAYDTFSDVPVYIKYNSSEDGSAYMKSYAGDLQGVIFQPTLFEDGLFRQYANLPLQSFPIL